MHLLGCILLLLFAAVAAAQSSYCLDSNFSGTTFFDNFDFWTAGDPTYGFVHYVDQATAEAYGMINVAEHPAEWRADATQVLDPNSALGRLSIRLTSIRSWTHGLFILDLVHMPPNQCGVWPAFWTLGSGTWPYNGEIDIIEYVGVASDNVMTLHTLGGAACTVAGSGQSGTLGSSNNCSAGGGYTGCSVTATLPDTVGSGFDETGGVYAMQWTSAGIQIWYFPRPQIPSSIAIGQPDPSTFGLPMANFAGDCDFDAHFFNHSIIFDTTFCGTYAGPEWGSQGCSMADPSNSWTSCNEFVANNPGAFNDTYWQVNYLAVYTTPLAAQPPPSTSLSSVPTASSTTIPPGPLGQSTTPTMPFPVMSSPTTTNTLPRRDEAAAPWACPIQSDCIPLGGSVVHPSSATAPSFPSDGVCNFYIPGRHHSQDVSTTYTCTFTGLGNVNGYPEPYTEWFTIPVASDKPVDLINVVIQSVHVDMVDHTDFESDPFTGIFTPTATSIHETTLTAYAVLPQRNRRGERPDSCQMSGFGPLPAPLSGPICDEPPRAANLPTLPAATGGWKKRNPDAQVESGGEIGFCSVPGAACQEHRRGVAGPSTGQGDDSDANPPIDVDFANVKREIPSSPVSGGSIGFCGVPGEGGTGCRMLPTELAKPDQVVEDRAGAQKRTARLQTESGGVIGWQGVPGESVDETIVAVAKTDTARAIWGASTAASAPVGTDSIGGGGPRTHLYRSSIAPAEKFDQTGVHGGSEEDSAPRSAEPGADSGAFHARAALPPAGLAGPGDRWLGVVADVPSVGDNGIVMESHWKPEGNSDADGDSTTFPVADEEVQWPVQARTAMPQAMLAVPGGPQLDVPTIAPTFVPFVPWGNGMELEPSGWKREANTGPNDDKLNAAINAPSHEENGHARDAVVPTYTPISFFSYSSTTFFYYSPTNFPSHSSKTFRYNPNTKRQADTLETTPVEILSDAVKEPSDGSEVTKYIQSATCTPVVFVGADGKPSPGGCMAPQNVFLTLSEHIVVANVTKTITQTAADPSNTPYLTNGQLMRVDSVQEKAHENAAASTPTKTYLTAALITTVAALLALWGRFW